MKTFEHNFIWVVESKVPFKAGWWPVLGFNKNGVEPENLYLTEGVYMTREFARHSAKFMHSRNPTVLYRARKYVREVK